MTGAAAALLAAALLAASAAALATDKRHDSPAEAYTYTIAPFAPSYTPPEPGSYELPPMGKIDDHPLVDAAGGNTSLARLTGGRPAVVSFIYGSCSEASGCPMSTAVMHRLDAMLAADPALSGHAVLLSVSFDPSRDRQHLARMQQARASGSTWQFVTAPDEKALQAMLDDFGQSITKVLRSDGSWTGQWRHVLKVFLLDEQRRVRNIYSTGFLDADLVRNDLMTVLLERLR